MSQSVSQSILMGDDDESMIYKAVYMTGVVARALSNIPICFSHGYQSLSAS